MIGIVIILVLRRGMDLHADSENKEGGTQKMCVPFSRYLLSKPTPK